MEIIYNPKSGYSIYHISTTGAKSYHGTVKTEKRAAEIYNQYQEDIDYLGIANNSILEKENQS